MYDKWPSKSQWGQFLKVLSKKEKNIFFVLFFIALASFFFLCINLYLKNTEIRPAKYGTHIEGLVGAPRFINPIYSPASDIDRDLTELIYSGLMKYDKEGKIIPDLAKEYKVSEDGKIYEFYLKENPFWSDGKPLTADDVLFTIKTIQNPSFKSPVRASWLGVKVDKISDLGIRFELKNPSAVFLEVCTVKILPEHIWQDISYQNFPLSIYNLKPIGSGPYRFKNLTQDNQNTVKSLELVANPYYYQGSPNILKFNFLFFDSEKELIKAAKSKKIDGFSFSSAEEYQNFKNKDFSNYQLSLPRYFAVFFNPNYGSKILSDDNIRQALNYATNKQEIIDKILLGKGKIVNSPILPEIYGLANPSKVYEFNQDKAKQLLIDAGFVEKENGTREKVVKREPAFQFKSYLKLGSQGNEVKELQKCLANPAVGGSDVYPEGEITGYFGEKTKAAVIKFQEKYRAEILTPNNLKEGTGEVKKSTQDKLNELCSAPTEETIPLSLTLTTVDQPILTEVANLLKKQWEPLGIKVEVKTFNISSLEEDVIKPRNYEMFLFGEVLGAIPDPFPFWHSSQVRDPGLNLASFEDKESDKLLESSRQTLDEKQRKTSLEKFQNILLSDAPAIFLYNPDYIYMVSKEIKGIDAKIIVDFSQRFSNIEKWYIKTKRVWK
jgi:ABC-type transport system substrate-binding protein